VLPPVVQGRLGCVYRKLPQPGGRRESFGAGFLKRRRPDEDAEEMMVEFPFLLELNRMEKIFFGHRGARSFRFPCQDRGSLQSLVPSFELIE